MTTRAPNTAAGVRYVEVTEAEAGQRLDNYLARVLKGVPRSRLYRIVRRGEVRVNRGRVRPDYRVQAGDRIRLPPVRTAGAGATRPPAPGLGPSLDERIVYQDRHLLVVDKPAGMAVHGGSGVSHGVIELLRAARPQERYLELVHRLDRDTSGCLMIARDRSTLRALHAALRSGAVDKHYLALVAGRWQRGRAEVRMPLRKHQSRSGERVVRVDEAGKPAVTRFRPVEFYRHATLVEVQLDTGRTHQIRVHAAASGHPVAGDDKYGERDFNRLLELAGLNRMFLHAQAIDVDDTPGGVAVHVSAPLDEKLRGVLERLER